MAEILRPTRMFSEAAQSAAALRPQLERNGSALARGGDPGRPPHLRKVTETR